MSSEASWLTNEMYSNTIQPLLARISNSAIASRLGVSRWYMQTDIHRIHGTGRR